MAPPCEADPAASCWDDAPRLTRFAAAPGVHHAPVEADVRIAWDGDGLLVRATALPADARVEVGHLPKLARGVEAARPGVGGEGVVAVPAGPPTRFVEGLFVAVSLPDSRGDRVALHWAPTGPADAIRPAALVRAAASSPGLDLTLSAAGDTLTVLAPGADTVTVTAEGIVGPAHNRPEPRPWTATGEDRVEAARPPDPGWLTVDAVWRDADDRPLDVQRRRLWWPGPAADGLSLAGLHPAPKAARRGRGTWRPRDGGRVCVDLDSGGDAAALLVDEVARFTGARLSTAGTGRCAVRFVDLDTMTAALPPGERDHPQAFAVAIDRKQVLLGARDRRTAAWAALALADLVGPDGVAPVVSLLDWPDIDERPLVHSLNLRKRPDWTPADYAAFLRRVVARGRYTTLYLGLWNAVPYPSRPELRRDWTRPVDDWRAVIAAGRALGLVVAPMISGPGHARWLTEARPELREDIGSDVIDLGKAEARALVTDVLDDLLSLFGPLDRVHIGHDEAIWHTRGLFGDERSPATAGTPRGLLLADSLRFHLGLAAERDLNVVVWSDLLLEGWNGRREGSHRALDLLTPDERARLTVAAWSKLGDPLTHLPPLGMPVMRVHTGYLDWKRTALADEAPQLAGEGLGLFVPAPWAAAGPPPGSRTRFYHSSAVLLAGTTGWDVTLADHSIATVHAGIGDLPAMRPGYRHVGTLGRPLGVAGAAPPPSGRTIDWPDSVPLAGEGFPLTPRAADAAAPVTIDADGAEAIAVLLADDVAHAAGLALLADLRHEPVATARAVATARLHSAGAEPVDVHLQHGIDIYAADAAEWAAPLWHAAASAPLAAEAGTDAADRRLWRVDLTRPDGLPLQRVEIVVERPGVVVLVGAARALVHPTR